MTDADQPDTQAAIERLKTEGLKIAGLSEPVDVTPSHDGKVAMVSFTMGGTQNDDANRAIVHEFRSQLDPSIFGGLPNVQTYVSGEAAASVDVTQVYSDGAPFIFLFVLGLSFLLMLVAFHSIVIPIKAIILNLLSTAAAYGVLVLVFQNGWFAGPLGITPSGVIESWVPLLIFTILFGLSMDYHLFILTRIKEARDRGLGSRAAVAKGISVTAGTITSAASIMVVVFAVFVGLKFVFIQQIGLGPRGRRLPRRDGHPERPPARVDDAARRLELVDAALPRLDPAGHDRRRSGRTGGAGRFGRGRGHCLTGKVEPLVIRSCSSGRRGATSSKGTQVPEGRGDGRPSRSRPPTIGALRSAREDEIPLWPAKDRVLVILVDPALTRGEAGESRPAGHVVPVEQAAELALDRLHPE